MGWKFYGYAAVYGSPDRDRDVLAQGCFTGFLLKPDHLDIPMRNAHDPRSSLGRWIRMVEDGYGLLVFGELDGDMVFSPPYPGLSVKPVNAQGSPHPNPWGGKLCRFADIEEISLVTDPAHHGARILGPW